MSYQKTDSWYAKSLARKVIVKATLSSRTDDDDWYTLRVYPLGDDGQAIEPGYPLKTSHSLRNITEVRLSRSGHTLVALECDGDAVVWTRGSEGIFEGVGRVYHIGSPVSELEIEDTDKSFTVLTLPGNTKKQVSLR